VTRVTVRRRREREHRRDVCAGVALIVAAVAIGAGWITGAAYLDCRHPRLAGAAYCSVFNGRR